MMVTMISWIVIKKKKHEWCTPGTRERRMHDAMSTFNTNRLWDLFDDVTNVIEWVKTDITTDGCPWWDLVKGSLCTLHLSWFHRRWST